MAGTELNDLTCERRPSSHNWREKPRDSRQTIERRRIKFERRRGHVYSREMVPAKMA